MLTIQLIGLMPPCNAPSKPGQVLLNRSAEASILFLTRYDQQGASTRYRFLQFFPFLEECGFRCTYAPLLDDSYLETRYSGRAGVLPHVVRGALLRLKEVLRARKYDLVVIEKELFPYAPALAERVLSAVGVPYVVDFDDALFHQYDQHPRRLIRALLGGKIAAVMRKARAVIAGNTYLANYARRSGAPRVEVLPTVVDLSRYTIGPARPEAPFTIGWIGSPSTTYHLPPIAPALAEICREGRGRVVLIGASEVELPDVPVTVLPWAGASEIGDMHTFDVGIMPLVDSPWVRGKCGFKLIQYMACGIPVVASPVGVNTEIVEPGTNGFLANDIAGWIHALEMLREDTELRNELGRAGREKVERQYSVNFAGPRLAAIFRSVLNGVADSPAEGEHVVCDSVHTSGN